MVVLGKPSPVFLLATDLDHTLVQNEDHAHKHLLHFNRTWNQGLGSTCILVYSTGRSPHLFKELWADVPLLCPDVMICSVGSEIYYRKEDGRSFRPDDAWLSYLDEGWDCQQALNVARRMSELVPQADSEQRRHKLSFHLTASPERCAEDVMAALRAGLQEAGVAAKVIYSGGVDVDIISERAGKGCALKFLLQQLRKASAYPALGVQVNGDSGNDVELFEVEGVQGCVVANAHPELDAFYQANQSPTIYKSKLPCSGGIVEALQHFGTLPKLQEASPHRHVIAAAMSAISAPAPQAAGPVAAPDRRCTLVSKDGSTSVAAAAAVAADQAAPPPDAWVDRVAVNVLGAGLWLVCCQSFRLTAAGERDREAVEAVTVVLEEGAGAEGGFTLRHLQRQPVDPESPSLDLSFLE